MLTHPILEFKFLTTALYFFSVYTHVRVCLYCIENSILIVYVKSFMCIVYFLYALPSPYSHTFITNACYSFVYVKEFTCIFLNFAFTYLPALSVTVIKIVCLCVCVCVCIFHFYFCSSSRIE